MDSMANPKVKTMKGEGIGACSLAHITSKVERHARARDWIRMSDKWFNYSHKPAQTK